MVNLISISDSPKKTWARCWISSLSAVRSYQILEKTFLGVWTRIASCQSFWFRRASEGGDAPCGDSRTQAQLQGGRVMVQVSQTSSNACFLSEHYHQPLHCLAAFWYICATSTSWVNFAEKQLAEFRFALEPSYPPTTVGNVVPQGNVNCESHTLH